MQKKAYLFKSFFKGTAKKTGLPFKVLELHDTDTLENTKFFLRDDQDIPLLSELKLKDAVEVEIGIDVYQGQPRVTVENVFRAKVGTGSGA